MATAVGSTPQLKPNAVGLVPVLFQSITHMAPAAAVAFSIIFATPYAGGSTALAVALALVACLLVASCIGQLARHLPSAGGFYTYASRSLNPSAGFLVGWGFLLSEPIVAPLLFLIFGNLLDTTLHSTLGTPLGTWWIWSIVAAVIVLGLTYFGVQLSTETGAVLGAFEIVVFLALAITLIVQAGSKNTLQVFTPSLAADTRLGGLSGIAQGMIFGILAFIGFEASIPLAEETKDPRRTIGRAVLLSCLGIGLFYVFTTYAGTVAFGPDKMANFPNAGNGDPWHQLAVQAWGPLWVLVFLAVANSAIANSNAGANAATRVLYAMGRVGAIPRAFARVHPRYRTPSVAVLAQFVYGVAVAVVLGFVTGGPLNAFALLGTVATFITILIYIAGNISCLRLYRREHPEEWNIWLHGVIPVAGSLVFVPPLVAAIGLPPFPSLTAPASFAAPIAIAWVVIGVAVLFYLRSNRPQSLQEARLVFGEAPALATQGAPVS
ncbi:MAG: APC family permease [Chloroflexi bacterium]|nr:MAG: APC family permease [Chloroflexota bacterium]